MNDEILNNNEEQPDEKELLRQRREEQIERVKAQYETDVKEKAEAKVSCLLYTSPSPRDS